jgi:arginyl-tRNA--protein-N-Asp/Glu arginylyltransferase
MKLLFSEAKHDYERYIFPYVVWAIPEAGEGPNDFYARGFLPSPYKDPERYYLCRSVRVELSRFSASSENRRVLRKGQGISHRLLPKIEFELSDALRATCIAYAKERFGEAVMPESRFLRVLASEATTHVLLFRDDESGRDVGLVTLFLERPHLAQYHFAFYDLEYYKRSLGMFMMTTAVAEFKDHGVGHMYLGSCYSKSALYKTQYEGIQWFDGAAWSEDLEALKYLITRDEGPLVAHLYETADYLHRFHDGALGRLVERSLFRLLCSPP